MHHHEKDPAYDNVILHVVWVHDTAIFGKNNTEVPVLLLKDYVSAAVRNNYNSLIFHVKSRLVKLMNLFLKIGSRDYSLIDWKENRNLFTIY